MTAALALALGLLGAPSVMTGRVGRQVYQSADGTITERIGGAQSRRARNRWDTLAFLPEDSLADRPLRTEAKR